MNSIWEIPVRRLLISILLVGVLGFLYWGLMYAWIVGSGALDPPHYTDARDALRWFFYVSIVAALAVGVVSLGPLRGLIVRHPILPAYLTTVGAVMITSGVVGMLVVLPVWGELSHPGGLTPDYGHTHTYGNFTGVQPYQINLAFPVR